MRVVALGKIIANSQDFVGTAFRLDVPGEEHIRGQQRRRARPHQEIAPGKALEFGGMLEEAALG
ncbi:hypothetical protein D9M72_538440 [compost metagenome]